MEKDTDISLTGATGSASLPGGGSVSSAASVGNSHSSTSAVPSKKIDSDSVYASGGELLIVIVDCNPLWWKSVCECFPNATLDPFISVWQSLLGLCNAHCLMDPDNEILITAVTPPGKSSILFSSSEDNEKSHQEMNQNAVRDGKCEKLVYMNDLVRKRLLNVTEEFTRKLVGQNVPCTELLETVEFRVSNALSKALCFYGRRCRERQPLMKSSADLDIASSTQLNFNNKKNLASHLHARVMIVRGSKDNASQYMHLMNGVFTAQKMHVAVDVCHLIHPELVTMHQSSSASSGISSSLTSAGVATGNLLQQAVKLTGGMYVPVSQWDGLLQYLLTLFLPRSSGLRQALVLSPGSALAIAIRAGLISAQVDFRAACFCHRRLVDIGYVCSVCLSIFCAFSPFCTTCYAHFKLPAGSGTAVAALPGASVGGSTPTSVTSKRRKKGG